MIPNGTLFFIAKCYMPHQDSHFYAHMDPDHPCARLEEDIASFNCKEVVIVMGDMNA